MTSSSSSSSENDDDDEHQHNYNFDYDEHGEQQTEEDEQKIEDRKAVLEQLQEECATMMKTLKRLHQEEVSIRCQNKILAREIIHCGYRGRELLECAGDGGATIGSSIDRDGNIVLVSSKRQKKKPAAPANENEATNGDAATSVAAISAMSTNSDDVLVKKEDPSCSAAADAEDCSILITNPPDYSIDGAIDVGEEIFNIALKEENE